MDHTHNLFLNFPWCSSCGPVIRALLAHARATGTLSGCMSTESSQVLSQDQLDAYVPVLVHRSQLAAAVGGTSIDAVEHGNDVPSTSSSTASVRTPDHPVASPDMTPHRKPRGVKVACTNCRRSNKKCDEGRPCQRCVKGRIEDTCANPSPKPAGRPRVARTASGGYSAGSTPAADAASFPSTLDGCGLPMDQDPSLLFSATPNSSGSSSAFHHPALGLVGHAERPFSLADQPDECHPGVYANYLPDTPPSWPPSADLYATWGMPDLPPSAHGTSGFCDWDYAGPSSL
ncbi:hypothetical protein VTO73DRAFT_455 [Trametes versicolor]